MSLADGAAMIPPTHNHRRGGVLIPLFSLWSADGWGIGKIRDLVTAARWLESAGQQILQILPINEMPPGDSSPYSALSAMAIDPLYIGIDEMDDFVAAGGVAALDAEARDELTGLRDRMTTVRRVDYATARVSKLRALRLAFDHFRVHEWSRQTDRSVEFAAFVAGQRWWLNDYSLFRALHAHYDERPWTAWPAALRDREKAALEASARELATDVLFRQYLQWIADQQWRHARSQLGGVALFGDLPFMVSGDSADVWARQGEFRHDASVGVPPDAFSETGQDWNLPVYEWDVAARSDFEWLRDRARRHSELYDGYRVDHLVGFYRTYFRPHDGRPPGFTPFDERDQIALGERVLGILRGSGVEITAEDLGLVPDFVRESLGRLGVPGYKVFRWERRWHQEGQPFIDPAEYAAATVATTGTHDTETIAAWWEMLSIEERTRVLEVPSIAGKLQDPAGAVVSPTLLADVHSALLAALAASGSSIVILPVQDVFGWTDRINTPATVSPENWTWVLPWPVERMCDEPEAVAAADRLRTLARRGKR